jgi:DNA repair protein RecO (recombination protein O)
MAVVSTKAIVISALKYSDSSLIVKCYTEELGLKSYILRGVLKSKKGNLKAAYFQPLTQLKIVATNKVNSNLNTLKEAHVTYPYKFIHTDIVKQSIVMFLSEMLSNCIQEEEENLALYEYLETAFLWLDTHAEISNFHLLFLLNLTRFLGFYPDISEEEKEGFNLIEGNFTNRIHDGEVISGSNFYQFKKLLGINFDTLEKMSLNKTERHIILEIIIRYFELHLDGFKKPKSLNILKTVFS